MPAAGPAISAGDPERRAVVERWAAVHSQSGVQLVIRKVVFPVAGLGTRMLPATKVLPKEMLPVVDRPIIQYALEEAARRRGRAVHLRHRPRQDDHGGSFRPRLRAVRDAWPGRPRPRSWRRSSAACRRPGEVVYTRQQEPKGLGHAVWCARARGRRRAVRGDAGRRSDRRRAALPRPDGRGPARDRAATCWRSMEVRGSTPRATA